MVAVSGRRKSDQPPFYLNPTEAAEHLNVGASTLVRWRKKGLLSCVRVGGRLIRYRRPDLDALMARHLIRVELAEP